jgi:hypothetical protein
MKTVLCLSLYNCQWNPAEFNWIKVKLYEARQNKILG